MRWDISGAPITGSLSYALPVEAAAEASDFPPQWLYAHAWIERIVAEADGLIMNAATYIDPTNGYGLLALTAVPAGYVGPWPIANWTDPRTNALFAVTWYLLPAALYWNGTYGFTGTTLLRCAAAEYNAGRAQAVLGHERGNVDAYTTGGDYGSRVLAVYTSLRATGSPT